MSGTNTLPALPETLRRPAPQLRRFTGPIVERISAWITTCLDHYAAAAMYEQLSKLSDAELERRGHTRATLARDLREKYDGTHIR